MEVRDLEGHQARCMIIQSKVEERIWEEGEEDKYSLIHLEAIKLKFKQRDLKMKIITNLVYKIMHQLRHQMQVK